MESNWAAEHLQTIRTLMERSAVYRRALAPIMTFNGVLGILGAVSGLILKIESARAFVLLWWGVACVGLAGSFLLVRRQALKDAEPFWSPPTRRVVQALLPPLTAGFLLGLFVLITEPSAVGFNLSGLHVLIEDGSPIDLTWVPLAWVVLYGCALHAAGFFTPRGLRLFGWLLVLAGSAVLIGLPEARAHPMQPQRLGHILMGCFFGLLHLAYGAYLYLSEKGKNAA